MQRLIVTIDGPAGAGKSTVARQLACRLNVAFLDTGAMYRGIAAMCLDAGVDPVTDPEAAIALAQQADLRFNWQRDPPRLLIDSRDVTHRLRDPDVTRRVSDVAQIGPLRDVLVQAQRRIGRQHPRLVTEGRDQGSVVFPHAQVKFFLDASVQVRAQRRTAELEAGGRPVDSKLILQQIAQRDHRDRNRQDGPLICPDDAIRIDTSDMTLKQVVDELEDRVRSVCDPDADDQAFDARQGAEP